MGGNDNLQMLNQRLDSWKEIAAFFKCDERTLRRWEKERGLPIHRAPGGAGGKVFAYTDELSAWLAGSSNAGSSNSGSFKSGSSNAGSSSSESPNSGLPKAGSSNSRIAASRPAAPAPPETDVESPRLFIVHEQHSGASVSQVARTTSRRWKILAGLLGVGFAVVGLALGWLYLSTSETAIAVLPFTNDAGEANTDYLSDGITETLIDNLTHIPQLKVRSRSSTFRYKGKDVDVRRIGKDLGVSMLVTGRLISNGNTIEVNAELTDVRNNVEIWGQHYRGNSAEILLLQQQIAGDIAENLHSKISVLEKQRVTRQATQSPEAYEFYLKGRYAWNKRTAAALAEAISDFDQAIEKDPGYALAYSGLADAYSVLPRYGSPPTETYPKSNAAGRRALELDPSLARAHAVLGGNEMQYDWDFAGGEAEFRKAWELDPNYATAHQWYAENIGALGGRDREAIAEISRAHQLDPLSPIIGVEVGYVHNVVHRYDEGIAICKKIATENPKFAQAHFCLAYGYWAKRMYPELIEERKAYAELSGDRNELQFASALDRGFGSGGWKGALTRGIKARKMQRQNGYYSGFAIAALYADLGEIDQAFQWLDTACQERDGGLTALKTDFALAPLRSDPRFAKIVRRVGLPQ